MTADDHVCVPLVDDDGQVVGHARVFPGLDEVGRRALLSVVAAARRLMAEQDAADPVAAAERGHRQAAGIERIRERARRMRETG